MKKYQVDAGPACRQRQVHATTSQRCEASVWKIFVADTWERKKLSAITEFKLRDKMVQENTLRVLIGSKTQEKA